MTCLDPRVVTEQFLGPNLGLPVYRNAGGRATEDAVRSILILKSLIGASAVLVIHHTGIESAVIHYVCCFRSSKLTPLGIDCGKTHIIEEELREDAKKRTPEAASEIDAYPSFRVGPASDFEKMIKEDVQILRSTSALAGVEIRGFGMDTATGLITELTIE